MRDTTDPIILDDANVQDPNEWLLEDEDEENAPVFEGEDLRWGDVAEAIEAGEAAYSTRASGSKRGDKASTSQSRLRRCLIDEEESDVQKKMMLGLINYLS